MVTLQCRWIGCVYKLVAAVIFDWKRSRCRRAIYILLSLSYDLVKQIKKNLSWWHRRVYQRSSGLMSFDLLQWIYFFPIVFCLTDFSSHRSTRNRTHAVRTDHVLTAIVFDAIAFGEQATQNCFRLCTCSFSRTLFLSDSYN